MPKHGKSSRVFIKGYDVSAYLSSVSMAGSADTVEATPFSSSDKVFVAGKTDATLRCEGGACPRIGRGGCRAGNNALPRHISGIGRLPRCPFEPIF